MEPTHRTRGSLEPLGRKNTHKGNEARHAPNSAAQLFLSFIGLAAASNVAQRGGAVAPAVPVDPVAAIIDAFRSHDVVALGDGAHGNEQSHAFRLALIRDPRFAATVNDVVVECGNARYQDLIDRFVHGEELADSSLRQVWRNTTNPTTLWDLPGVLSHPDAQAGDPRWQAGLFRAHRTAGHVAPTPRVSHSS